MEIKWQLWQSNFGGSYNYCIQRSGNKNACLPLMLALVIH